MKIAFSTLGSPDWSWGETVAAAKDLGYDGLEIRGVQGEFCLPQAHPFLPDRIEETKAHLRKIGLSISCLSSACYLQLADRRQERLKEGIAYIELAERLGAPFVRVLGDMEPFVTQPVDDGLVAEGLRILAEAAAGRGVKILLETNGVYSDSSRIRRVLEQVNDPRVGVLWDIHHPYRFAGEPFAETWDRLQPFINYLHIKDSIRVGDKVRYCLLGEGDLPLKELAEALRNGGYQGWVSLEWVKKWHPDLEEPGIVFPHFIHKFKTIFCA